MQKSWLTFLIISALLFTLAWAVGGHEVRNYIPYYAERIAGKTVTVTIDGVTIYAEVAQSERAKAKGLSGRERLQEFHGMYFPFAKAAAYEFWMPNMLMPLDIVWLDSGTIVDISRSVPAPRPGEEPARVKPVKPASAVLEVRAGVAQAWLVGDAVQVRDDGILFR